MYQYFPDSFVRIFQFLYADCKMALVFQDYTCAYQQYTRGVQEIYGKVHSTCKTGLMKIFIFLQTFSNIRTYTCYIIIVSGLNMVLILKKKKKKKKQKKKNTG